MANGVALAERTISTKMANSEVLDLVIQSVASTIQYMLPVVAFLAGANWVMTWIFAILFRSQNTRG